jgi:hypothetical protein
MIHVPCRWEPADETARLALSVTSSDEGKFAWQQDDDSIWMLTDSSTPTWVEVGASFDYASQAQAEAGTAEGVVMNPLRTAQAIAALGGSGGMWEFASKADISSDATVEFTDLAAGYAYRWELTNIRSASPGPLDLQMAIGYGATPTWGLSLSTSISRVDSNGVHTGAGTLAATAKLTDVLYDSGTGVHGSVVGYLVQGTRPAFSISTMAGNVSFVGHTGYNDTVQTITAVRFHASSGDLAGGKIEMFRRALN